jgi:hypothetical protein
MRGRAGMEVGGMEVGGMEVGGMEAGGMEAGGMEAGGMEAGGGEAHGWVSVSASGHSGGRIGGHTGGPMPTPMATRPSSPCHPPQSMCNPQHRPPPSLLHQRIGITATKHGVITPISSSAPEDGERWLQHHNSQHAAL